MYGPVLDSFRELFWEELGSIRGLWDDLWCVWVNFNIIHFPNEHWRGERLSLSMRRFFKVIEDLGLRDI